MNDLTIDTLYVCGMSNLGIEKNALFFFCSQCGENTPNRPPRGSEILLKPIEYSYKEGEKEIYKYATICYMCGGTKIWAHQLEDNWPWKGIAAFR